MGKKVYEIITDQILESLKAGIAPWRKPWKGGTPKNLRGNEYRGVNAFLLSMSMYETPIYATYNQIKNDLGGQVKKGEHGFPVVFWKPLTRRDKSGQTILNSQGKPDTFPMMRYYTVFNIDQATVDPKVKSEVLDALIPHNDHKPIEEAEKAIQAYLTRSGVKMMPDGARAFYRPSKDSIGMPAMSAFDTPEEYYSTAFHECGHSTGHKTRLDREGITDDHYFGDAVYSFEELIAEMTAAMSCGRLGLEQATLKNSAAYIQGWLKALQGDPKLVIKAGSQAQKATDLIFGVKAKEQD